MFSPLSSETSITKVFFFFVSNVRRFYKKKLTGLLNEVFHRYQRILCAGLKIVDHQMALSEFLCALVLFLCLK